MLLGQLMPGASVSLTVTLKPQLPVLPEASVAVQVTLFVPTAKVEPLVGVQLVVAPGQLSLAEALKLTTAEHCPGSVPVTMLVGQFAVGDWVSLTMTLNEQLLVLPLSSVAVQVTLFVPTPNVEPLAGVQPTTTLVQLSLALAE